MVSWQKSTCVVELKFVHGTGHHFYLQEQLTDCVVKNLALLRGVSEVICATADRSVFVCDEDFGVGLATPNSCRVGAGHARKTHDLIRVGALGQWT